MASNPQIAQIASINVAITPWPLSRGGRGETTGASESVYNQQVT